ncbi:Phage protein [Brevibacillus aydinogluensis]|uniref:Phage protein n=2 Tax=Brevibacillus TaxID=55080 RepID=A0AA48RJ61_9BACL|nr:Phage protein [Brevibacillus aydinogluensis]
MCNMSKSVQNWQRFWKFMVIYFYALIVPATALMAIIRKEFPLDLLILAAVLPFIKRNHLNLVKKKHATN